MDMSELRCEQYSSQKIRKESSLQFSDNFYVIQFDDGLALVPNNWLRNSDDQQVCFYPNYNVKKRLNKAIRSKEMPDLRNVKAGWTMNDVLRIYASADTFERGQEKLKMAENLSDINTEDEENMKQTRHDRAAAKNFTSDEESSGAEVDSGLLPPLPDPMEFSQQLFHSEKAARILATYEHPIISLEKDKIKIVRTEKKKQKIIQQETEVIAKHKKKELEDKNQESFINEDNVHSIDEYNKEQHLFTTHVNKNNEDQSQKVLKEILKKVNRILVEMTYIDRRLSRLENKADHITNKEINVNTVEEAFAFNTISSMDELQLFEQNLKNEEFSMKMRNLLKLKGGTNLQDMIKNIFKTLIKDEILMLYSWKGARGKNAFQNFKIVNLIIAVVRLYDANSTEEIITKVMINWIVQAPARVRRIVNKQNNQINDVQE